MPTYTQDNRPLSVKTPLGKDVLLLVGLTGHEAISRLFNFQLDLLAEDASKVKFDKLLGRRLRSRSSSQMKRNVISTASVIESARADAARAKSSPLITSRSCRSFGC